MINTIAEIKAAKTVIVLILVAVAVIKRRRSRKKRFSEIKQQIETGGALPENKFPLKDEFIRQFEASKKKRQKAIKSIIGPITDNKPYIEIRDNGLYFSIIFISINNYKKAVANNQPYIFVPWQDMDSIRISSLGSVRLVGTRERYAENSVGLAIKIKKDSQSKFIGKRLSLNLSVIDRQNDLFYLVKHYAKDLFKQKI